MSAKQKVNDGDRVRVVLEGKAGRPYRDDGTGSFLIGPYDANLINPGQEHVVSVEVLPRPLAVGDTIEDEDDYERLPAGAVVTGYGGVLLRTTQGFTNQAGRHSDARYWHYPRTIAHLPGTSE